MSALQPEVVFEFDWSNIKAECHQVFEENDRDIEALVEHFGRRHFWPGATVFRSQLRKWRFPPDKQLCARVKDFWNQNYNVRQMVEALNKEGFDMTPQLLSSVRSRLDLKMRQPNGTLSKRQPLGDSSQPTPEELERFRERKLESDMRLLTRTRRVRTVSYNGIPPDPADQKPRYPSERTISASKKELRLDEDRENYTLMRETFQDICNGLGVKKKTSDYHLWEKAKEQLKDECPFLKAQFQRPATAEEASDRWMSLEIICSDVAKKIRTDPTKMSMPEAKRLLQINPELTTNIRDVFEALLQNARFTSKLDLDIMAWKRLKEDLRLRFDHLQAMVPKIDTEDDTGEVEIFGDNRCKRALEFVCRDVMKRFRENRLRTQKTMGDYLEQLSAASLAPASSQTSDFTQLTASSLASAPDQKPDFPESTASNLASTSDQEPVSLLAPASNQKPVSRLAPYRSEYLLGQSLNLDVKSSVEFDVKPSVGLDVKPPVGLDVKPPVGLDVKPLVGLDVKSTVKVSVSGKSICQPRVRKTRHNISKNVIASGISKAKHTKPNISPCRGLHRQSSVNSYDNTSSVSDHSWSTSTPKKSDRKINMEDTSDGISDNAYPTDHGSYTNSSSPYHPSQEEFGSIAPENTSFDYSMTGNENVLQNDDFYGRYSTVALQASDSCDTNTPARPEVHFERVENTAHQVVGNEYFHTQADPVVGFGEVAIPADQAFEMGYYSTDGELNLTHPMGNWNPFQAVINVEREPTPAHQVYEIADHFPPVIAANLFDTEDIFRPLIPTHQVSEMEDPFCPLILAHQLSGMEDPFCPLIPAHQVSEMEDPFCPLIPAHQVSEMEDPFCPLIPAHQVSEIRDPFRPGADVDSVFNPEHQAFKNYIYDGPISSVADLELEFNEDFEIGCSYTQPCNASMSGLGPNGGQNPSGDKNEPYWLGDIDFMEGSTQSQGLSSDEGGPYPEEFEYPDPDTCDGYYPS